MTKETMEVISIMQSHIDSLNLLKSSGNFNESQIDQLNIEIETLQNRIKLYE